MTKQTLWELIEAYRMSGGSEEHHARKEQLDAVLDGLLAQPKQEPVGVVALNTSRPFVSGIHNGHVMPWSQAPNVKTVVMFKDLPLNTSLYDTPPQRKPLTFEQVEDCFPDGYSTEDNGILVSAQWLHDFARAIEAAHGIKE